MDTRILSSPAELESYDACVKAHPEGNLWQSLAWKKYQESLGRETRVYGMENGKWKMENERFSATALVVIDRTAGGFSTWEIPRGPLWISEAAAQELLNAIINEAQAASCLAIYTSPTKQFSIFNFQFSISRRHIHPQATRILNLTPSEEQILAQMHQKGRYNIGVAKKTGMTVREGSKNDIHAFYALLKGTGGRDGFTISQKSHYARFLGDLEGSFLLLAEHEGKPIAGLLGATWHGTGIYYYGASSYEHRSLMAPYLLQWEAMRKCKAAGCMSYDLFGIEAPKEERNAKYQMPNTKNSGFWNLDFGISSRSWAGISDFKRKFGGTVVPYPPEQQWVLRPMAKWVLDVKRKVIG